MATEEKQPIQEQPEGFELKFFIKDLKDLIIHPKETARKVADAPCAFIAFTSIFLAGCSMGLRKLMSHPDSLNLITGAGKVSSSAKTILELGTEMHNVLLLL